MRILSLLTILLICHVATIFTRSTTVSRLAKKNFTVKASPENCQKCLAIVADAAGHGNKTELAKQKYIETYVYFTSGAHLACGRKQCRHLVGQISYVFRKDKSLVNATDRQLCEAAQVCV